MTTPTNRRFEMIDRMADFVLAHGLAAASLRPLAAAAGTSDRMLLYHFKDKAEIIGAVLHCLTQRLTAHMVAQTSATPMPTGRLRRKLVQIATHPDVWPYMQLWLEIAALSARGDPVFRKVGHDIGQGFLGWIVTQSEGGDPADALRLLTLLEGRIILKSIGLFDTET